MSNLIYITPESMISSSKAITEDIRKAKGLGEMAKLLSNALNREINKDKRLSNRNSRISDFLKGPYICWVIPGGIKGNHKLENLIAELVVAYISAEPTPGEKRLYNRPSFAFLVAGLSALPCNDKVEEDFRQIIRTAYDIAIELSTAAIEVSHADTLRDMERGIRAVQELEKNTTLFSRHVAACLMAHRNLIEAGCTTPTKGHVRDEAKKLLNGWDFSAFDDSAHWRQVYQAAGMKDLPQARPGRSESVYGD